MDPEILHAGMARFAADLSLAGEPIALDAVVERHLVFLLDARAAKLRWPSVARMLARAGARRADGTAISADQIRASVSRAKRRRAVHTAQHWPPAARVSPPAEAEQKHRIAQGSAVAPTPQKHTPLQSPIEPDLSDADILAARRRVLGA